MKYEAVDTIVSAHNNSEGQLIGILQDVQKKYNYLPRPALDRVSTLLGIPISRVYSVATFFKAFSLEPRGKNHICVCMGTACHVHGSPRVLEELERDIGIKAGETDKNRQFTLETVNCVGCCALGPVVVVNEEYHGKMDSQKVSRLVRDLKGHKRDAKTQK